MNCLSQNRTLVLRVYRSSSRNDLLSILERFGGGLIDRGISDCARDMGTDVDPEEQAFMPRLYLSAFMGVIDDWLAQDMRQSPAFITSRCNAMMALSIRGTLSRLNAAPGDSLQSGASVHQMDKGYRASIPLMNAEGITFATAEVSPGGVTILFNDNVDALYDVQGSYWFEAMAVNAADTQEESTQTAEITAGNKRAEVAIHKAGSGGVEGGEILDVRKQADSIGGGYTWVEDLGWVMSLDPEDPTYTQWILTANENQLPVRSDFSIQDTLGPGQALDPSYLLLYSTGNITATYTGTVAEVVSAWNRAYSDSELQFGASGGLPWRIGRETADGTYWCLIYRCEITDFSLAYFENAADNFLDRRRRSVPFVSR